LQDEGMKTQCWNYRQHHEPDASRGG
jgi:hypothetical protein